MSTQADPLEEFRRWIVATLDYGDPVRAEAVRTALSATVMRTINFGLESSFSHHRSRDLLQFQVMGMGGFGDHLLRVAFTRAVVEDDRDVLGAFRRFGVAPEQVAWFDGIDGSDAATGSAAIAAIADPEELAVTRLVLARRHPALIEPKWWWEVPEGEPLIASQIIMVALRRRPELAPAVPAFLRERHDVLFADEPDNLLAALVRAEGSSPQTVLRDFDGCYADNTLLAAAEWHLEHNEPLFALEMAKRVRQLAWQYDRALMVAGLALIEIGRVADASRIALDIGERTVADRLVIRIAKADPALVDADAVYAIGGRCAVDQPELFFAVLQALLVRRQLGLARSLCDARGPAFVDHEPIAAAMREICGHG